MNTIKKGKLGYNLLEKELLKRDYDIYLPILEDTKVDCIVIKNNILLKLQIKTIQKDGSRKILPVRKISHNQGQYKVHLYSENEIDYFIGVDIETEDIYVCPINFISQYSSAIGISKLQPYKNNFDLMEPIVGNNDSGADDIGKSLTGNTEGTK